MKPFQLILLLGAFLGFSSVAIGAFAAHGLKGQLTEQAMAWLQTGVQYQMAHSLVILVLGFALKMWPNWSPLKYSAYGFGLGILLFSGSLYFMAITHNKALVLLTPIGGLCLLVAWGILVVAAWRGHLQKD